MELKVNKDGSCEAAYIIDASQFDGFLTVDQIEESFKQSVEETNTKAGKTVAVLKSVKENKKDDTITVTVSISTSMRWKRAPSSVQLGIPPGERSRAGRIDGQKGKGNGSGIYSR